MMLERLWYYIFTDESYNTIDECLNEIFIDIHPIIMIYCNKRKRVWFKQIHMCKTMLENKHSYIIYYKNGVQKTLPGVDISGPHIDCKLCQTIEQAKHDFFFEDVIKVYCNQRKQIWYKNINLCSHQVKNNNTHTIYLSGNEQKILSGIDFIGPDLHTEPCMNLETAFFKDFFRDVDSHINIYCHERKKVWYKNIYQCSHFVKNMNTCILCIKNDTLIIISGVDYVGPDISEHTCNNIESAMHSNHLIPFAKPFTKLHYNYSRQQWQ